MSNLGQYQEMTTLAKKVGGPRNLAAIDYGCGVITGVVVLGLYSYIKNKINVHKQKRSINARQKD